MNGQSLLNPTMGRYFNDNLGDDFNTGLNSGDFIDYSNSGGSGDYSGDYSNNGGGTSLKLANIFNTGASLTSQLISSLGQRPTQQIADNNGVVSPIANLSASAYGNAGSAAAQQQALLLRQQQAPNSSLGDTSKQAVDSITSLITKNPLIILFGVGALFLFMHDPKSSGRR